MTTTNQAGEGNQAIERIEALIDEVRERHGGDPRLSVFDVEVVRSNGRLLVRGDLTDPAAAEALARQIRQGAGNGMEVEADLRVIPSPDAGLPRAAVVGAMVAPMLRGPEVRESQVSQAVLGTPVEVLRHWRRWYHARTPDGYLGWIHQGYLELGDGEHELTAESLRISLGTPLTDERGTAVGTLPWGARVHLNEDGTLRLPGGAAARGEERLVDPATARDRFPGDPEAVVRTALGWLGSPYLWGGTTPAGVDCSGFVQAVYRLHGVELPRDSDLQAEVGAPADPGADFRASRPGDLLFFAEDENRITHVTLSLGGGRIVHASLGNGGTEINDLAGDLDYEQELREIFVCARRPLG
jgi:gamma-D-glutamyl-L-lysine dipeptidyl-peptidase